MGQLWDLVERYRTSQPFPPSYRRMADRLDMSVTAFTSWRTPKDPPAASRLLALADLINVPYVRLLDAVLHDTGYLPEDEVRAALSPGAGGPSLREALRMTDYSDFEGHQVDDVAARDPDA